MTSKFGGTLVDQAPRSRFGGTPVAAPTEQPSSLTDAALSIPGGLARGVAAITGDAANFATDTLSNLADKTIPGVGPWLRGAIKLNTPRLPTSEDASAAFHQPETTAGEYAQTISSFAPAAAAPGGLVRRAANVIVPAVISETAGQATKGTKAEPFARVGGGLFGAGAVASAPTIARTGARILNRGYNAATGREFLDPEREARTRLAAAILRDGGSPAVSNNLNQWAGSGASDPSLIDVAGNNVRRLVRSAAAPAEGDAQNIAQTYQNRVAGNLQDNTSRLARGLTPNDQRTAEQLSGDLETQQRTLANEQYAVPYAEPASVTREMVSALQGSEGRGAIGRALRDASANRDVQQQGELRDLLAVAQQQSGGQNPLTGRRMGLEEALQSLSAGALDRVRIAMRETGGALARNGMNNRARGYRDRVTDIDTALDQTPGLQPARATYRHMAQQREAVETGQSALNAPSEVYRPQAQAMTPESRAAAQVGYRQSIVNAVERPAQGSTGLLNRLATSNNQTANLADTFGPEAGARFQAGVGNEVQRVQNARFINPNTGSQTAPRGDEAALIDALPSLRQGFLSHVITLLRNGTTLTATERAAIVRLGTTERDLRRMVNSLPQHQPQQIAQHLLIAGQLGNGRRQ